MASAGWSTATAAEFELRSKTGTSLNRYFPDLVAAVAGLRARRGCSDGETILPVDAAAIA